MTDQLTNDRASAPRGRGTRDNRTPDPDGVALTPRGLDITLALVIWVGATAALVLLGDRILPGPNDGFATAFAYLLTALATLFATYWLTVLRMRLGGERLDSASGLRLGAVILVVGLFLDGIVLAVTGFDYPNIDAERTQTIAVAFLLVYPFTVVGPWMAGLRSRTVDGS